MIKYLVFWLGIYPTISFINWAIDLDPELAASVTDDEKAELRIASKFIADVKKRGLKTAAIYWQQDLEASGKRLRVLADQRMQKAREQQG